MDDAAADPFEEADDEQIEAYLRTPVGTADAFLTNLRNGERVMWLALTAEARATELVRADGDEDAAWERVRAAVPGDWGPAWTRIPIPLEVPQPDVIAVAFGRVGTTSLLTVILVRHEDGWQVARLHRHELT